MTKISDLNRRDYFRIDDKALLDYRLADGSDPSEDFYRHIAHYEMLRDLRQLDADTKNILGLLSDKDRTLGAYLKVLDKKIALIAKTVALNDQDLNIKDAREINLSEGGIAFKADEQLKADSILAIKMILLADFSALICTTKVLDCFEQDGYWLVRTTFIDLDEASKKLVARHILRKQQVEKRKRLDEE